MLKTSRPVPFKRVLLIFAIPIILGLVGGISFTYLNVENWYQIEEPPVTPVNLIDGTLGKLIIQAQDGKIYYFVQNIYGLVEHGIIKGDWLPVKEGDINSLVPVDYLCGYKAIYTPPIPGKVKDSLKRSFCGIEAFVDVRYVLTDDGIIWEWISKSSLTYFVEAILYGFIGAVSGFIIGYTFFVISARNKGE